MFQAIVGLTAYASKAHIARAALESTAFQVRDVLSAMRDDGVETTRLKVDGGMTANGLLMQFQADVLNTQVGCRDCWSRVHGAHVLCWPLWSLALLTAWRDMGVARWYVRKYLKQRRWVPPMLLDWPLACLTGG